VALFYTRPNMMNVLFVCLGNICRSPMAEGLFRKLIAEKGVEADFEVDSAGIIDYHQGNPPDYRMRQTAAAHGIQLQHRSRPVSIADFSKFDYIVAMDRNNLAELERIKPKQGSKARLLLMREFDGQKSGKDVEDPYYSEQDGFEKCYQVLDEACQNFLASLLR